MKIRAKRVEELILPPLPEYTYICNGEMNRTVCSGNMIFRDPDYITIFPSDVLTAFSLSSIISLKLRGRKYERWKGYIKKYGLELQSEDTRFLLSTDSFLTIYVDGLDIDGTSGEVVIKEYKLISTEKIQEERVNVTMNLKPHLLVIDKSGFWKSIYAYKIVFMDEKLRNPLKQFIGVKTLLDCKETRTYVTTLICIQ